MDLQHSILAPRVHVSFNDAGEPVAQYEADPAIAAAIARHGWKEHKFDDLAMFFGGVGAAYRTASGQLSAVGDPRRESSVAVF